MSQIKPSTLLFGFLIATLLGFILWYYQRSTTVEDGALDLLDRYAKSQTRLRELEARLRGNPRALRYLMDLMEALDQESPAPDMPPDWQPPPASPVTDLGTVTYRPDGEVLTFVQPPPPSAYPALAHLERLDLRFEGAFELLDVGEDAETALSVGMLEWIGCWRRRLWSARFAAGGEFQERFRSFHGQTFGECEDGIFVRFLDVVEPFGRNAEAEQFGIWNVGED